MNKKMKKLEEKYVGVYVNEEDKNETFEIKGIDLYNTTWINEDVEKPCLALDIICMNENQVKDIIYFQGFLTIIIDKDEKSINIARRYLTNAGFSLNLAQQLCKDIAKMFNMPVNMTYAGNVEQTFV